MSQSIRYQIGTLLFAALQAAPALAGATLKRNPRGPAPLIDGERVVYFEEQTLSLIDKNAQQASRSYVFAVGVVNRSEDAEARADADYLAATAAIQGAYVAVSGLLASIKALPKSLTEQQQRFTVDDIDVDGALVEGTWELTYLEPKPAR